MLPYQDGPVADLLRSIKRNFGTEGEARKAEQNSAASGKHREANDLAGGRLGPSGYPLYADYGELRLPTTREISRWPREMVRRFFRWINTVLQNHPLLIDPNSPEDHHGLPKEFIKYFMDCGLTIKEFIIILRAGDHRLKPDGLHTGEGKGGRWNAEWRKFIKNIQQKIPPNTRNGSREISN